MKFLSPSSKMGLSDRWIIANITAAIKATLVFTCDATLKCWLIGSHLSIKSKPNLSMCRTASPLHIFFRQNSAQRLYGSTWSWWIIAWASFVCLSVEEIRTKDIWFWLSRPSYVIEIITQLSSGKSYPWWKEKIKWHVNWVNFISLPKKNQTIGSS